MAMVITATADMDTADMDTVNMAMESREKAMDMVTERLCRKTNEQKFIISLIRKSFNLDKTEYTEEIIDEEEVINIIKRNGILLTVYPTLGALKNTDKLKEKLQLAYFATLQQAVYQKHEGSLVLESLSGSGLNCIALKGWELKNFYPNPNMRQMADVDILVRPYEYDSIKELMEKLGFEHGRESAWKHDSFRKGRVHIEMHKRLTDDSKYIKQWETEMWERSVPDHEHIYKMSIEDFYIYHFIHLYKDFLNGSLGLRRIIDTWILLKQPKNDEFIADKLTLFGLSTFHDRIAKLSRALMGEEEIDENSEIMLDHAFSIGIFGNGKSYKTGRIVSMSRTGNIRLGKLKSWVSAIFLPFDRMKAQFPVLEKKPILLPYYWIKRIRSYLTGNVKTSKQMLDYRDIDNEEYQKMKIFFKAGGV